MRYARYIGRVGGLAVALGIGAGLAAMPWVASADCTTLICVNPPHPPPVIHPLPTLPNISVSTNGVQRIDRGTAEADSEGTGSRAIARGDQSTAIAYGDHNTAIANGAGSTATATDGTYNTAKVNGIGSTATATEGDYNTATVTGNASDALAGHGSQNTATITGDDFSVASAGLGD
ncbi:MAG TPA: hypothetical protein VKA77_15885, partial [Mycobacterium sp.]|nr:hypothetical protein [Mycobacterium sp.]